MIVRKGDQKCEFLLYENVASEKIFPVIEPDILRNNTVLFEYLTAMTFLSISKELLKVSNITVYHWNALKNI